MKKLEVYITSKSISRSYKIQLEDEFALEFEKELKNILDGNNFLDAKVLLNAFVKKSYESYLQSKELDELIKKIEDLEKLS